MLNLLVSMKELLKDAEIIKKSSFFVYQNVRKLRSIQKNEHKGGTKRSLTGAAIKSKKLF